MLKYDEKLLKLRLEPLDRSAKTAFAAVCAQRLMPLYDRYARQVGDSSLQQRLAVIVSAAWAAASARDVEASRLEADTESMVPDEDEGWTAGRAYAVNFGRPLLPMRLAPGSPTTLRRLSGQLGSSLTRPDDILTTPGTVTRAITGGNFSGGRYCIAPDGRGAAFDADGVFQYFGVFTP